MNSYQGDTAKDFEKYKRLLAAQQEATQRALARAEKAEARIALSKNYFELAKLKSALEGARQRGDEMAARADKAEADRDDYKRTAWELNNDCTRLRADVERLTNRFADVSKNYAELFEKYESARADVETLTQERDRLQGVVERDRTKAAEIIATARAVVSRRSWLAEGRGSFSYDDEKYQEEFGAAITEMLEALQPLGVLAADWSDCPKDFQAARIDWKARAEAAERKIAMAMKVVREAAELRKAMWPGSGIHEWDRTLAELEKADG